MSKSLLFRPQLALLLCLFLLGLGLHAQTGNPDSLTVRAINAGVADPQVPTEADAHQIFYNPTAPNNDRLLLYLMGSFDIPDSTTLFPSLAANNGIRAIVLNYKNGVPASFCSGASNLACHENFRQEIVFGTPASILVNVDTANSIYTRFEKLLQYLHANFPTENWNQFLDGNQEIDWSAITAAGHSQGGGHAVYLGKTFQLDRIISFASPNEFNDNQNQTAPWIFTAGATPVGNHFAFANRYDDAVDFERFYTVWKDLNLLPLGDTFLVDGRTCPDLASHMLYTTDTTRNSNIAPFHSLVVRDKETPRDSSGAPIFEDVWRYLLGICDSSNTAISLSEGSPDLHWVWKEGFIHLQSDRPMEEVIATTLNGQITRIQAQGQSTATLPLSQGFHLIAVRFSKGDFAFRKILLK